MGGTEREGSGPVEVRIFGRNYLLRSDGDGERLARLAAIVDAKMTEIAETTSTADTLKVAIMAALNIADDYLDASRPTSEGETPSHGSGIPADDVEARLDRLVTLLDEALAG